MIKHSKFFFQAILFSPILLCALPQGEQVVSGDATFSSPTSGTLEIHASDKAIVNYSSFNIGPQETVRFVQPSSKSMVLNRVTGKEASYLSGALQSNGRLFFVNQNGVYFGNSARIDVGSLVVSTLDIADQDFLAGRLRFVIGKEGSKISNEGTLRAEESIAFLGPQIENKGSIVARTGNIALASGSQITLDFTGDGLLNFCIEGALQESFISQAGSLSAPQGEILIKMGTADRLLKSVVNTEGMSEGVALVKENGTIKILSEATLAARHIQVEAGANVEIAGKLDVSSTEGIGGALEVLGDQILLTGAQLNADGPLGGGQVRIGGDYQGKGDLRNAQSLVMDESSQINASALENGDGGRVILWADGITHFNGKIYVEGGPQGGDGGFVETSGKIKLGVLTGYVNSHAPLGKWGNWLLDPDDITIASTYPTSLTSIACSASPSFLAINASAINASSSPVSLCANSQINVNENIAITQSGVSLTLICSSGTIVLENVTSPTSITTNNGSITFNGPVALEADVAVNAGNATITFTDVIVGDSASLGSLTLTAGTINFQGGVGSEGNQIGSLLTTGAVVVSTNNITTQQNISFDGSSPITLGTDSTISSLSGNITFGNTIDGAHNLNVSAPDSSITFVGNIGGTTPLSSLTANGESISIQGNQITITGDIELIATTSAGIEAQFNIISNGGSITFGSPTVPSPVILTGSTQVNSSVGNQPITFYGTIDGNPTLLLVPGTSTLTFTGAVGGTTPVGGLHFSTGSLPSTIFIGSNITTTGAEPLAFPASPIIFTGNSTISTTNAAITFTSTLNSDTTPRTVILSSGTGGSIGFGGAIGGVHPLASLQFSGGAPSSITIGSSITTIGSLTFPSSPIIFTGSSTISITTTNNTITFGGTLDSSSSSAPLPNVNVVAGTGNINFNGVIGGSTPFGNLSASGATVSNADNITVSGTLSLTGTAIDIQNTLSTHGNPIILNGPVTLTGNLTVDSTNGGAQSAGDDISFSSTVDGGYALTLLAGTNGDITFGGAIGGSGIPTAITITNANNATFAGVTADAFTQTAGAGTTTFNGSLSIPSSVVIFNGNNFTFNNTASIVGIEIHNRGILTLTNSANLTVGSGGNLLQLGSGGSASNSLAGTLTATGAVSFDSPTVLTGTFTMPASTAITFSSTINGDNDLYLTSSGTVTFGGAIGSTTPLGDITIALTGGGVMASSSIAANSLTQTGTGTGTYTGALNITGVSGLSLTGTTLTLGNTVTSLGPITISNSGILTMSGAVSSTASYFSQTGSGAVHLSSSITALDELLISGTLTLTSASSLTSTSDNISLVSTVDGPGALTATALVGDITFTGAVGSTTALSGLTVSGAEITFTGNIGGGSSGVNGATSVTTTDSITFHGTTYKTNGTQAYIGTLAAQDFVMNATGTTTFSSNGNNISFNVGTIQISSATNLVINSTGGTITAATIKGPSAGILTLNAAGGDLTVGQIGTSTTNFSTGVTLIGAHLLLSGPIKTTAITLTPSINTTLGGNISTAGSNGIAFGAHPVILSAASVSLLPGSGTGSGAITFGSTLDGKTTAGSNALTITSTGAVTFSGAVGGTTRLGALTINATSVTAGAITANSINNILTTSGSYGALTTTGILGVVLKTGTTLGLTGAVNTTGSGPVALTNTSILTVGVAINASGAFTQSGAGATALNANITANGISFQSAITSIGTAVTLSNGGGSGDISLAAVTGAHNLTLTGGTGDITLNGTVSLSGLSILHITTARNLTTNTITAYNVTQDAGSGTTTVQGVMTTTDIVLHPNNLRIGAAMTATGTIHLIADTIQNLSTASPTLTSTQSPTLNSLGGDLGSSTSPIAINTTPNIELGAHGIAYLSGTPDHTLSTIDQIPTNPPCGIFFNGIELKNCNPPSLPTSQGVSSFGRQFFVAGTYSLEQNIADDAYFFLDWVDEKYMHPHSSVLAFNTPPKAQTPTAPTAQAEPEALPVAEVTAPPAAIEPLLMAEPSEEKTQVTEPVEVATESLEERSPAPEVKVSDLLEPQLNVPKSIKILEKEIEPVWESSSLPSVHSETTAQQPLPEIEPETSLAEAPELVQEEPQIATEPAQQAPGALEETSEIAEFHYDDELYVDEDEEVSDKETL